MKIRYLPITCLYSSSTRENCVPLICISGKWLERQGLLSEMKLAFRLGDMENW